MLSQIRLHGETKEVVSEIVTLAVRYGILTPYTSFLVDERKDVFSEQGRSSAAQDVSKAAAPTGAPAAGSAAVQQSQQQSGLKNAETAPNAASGLIKAAGDKTFILRSGVWTDTLYDPSTAGKGQEIHKIEFGSGAYFALLAAHPEAGQYLAVGTRVLLVLNGTVYQVTDDQSGSTTANAVPTAAVSATPAADSGTRPQPTVYLRPNNGPQSGGSAAGQTGGWSGWLMAAAGLGVLGGAGVIVSRAVRGRV